MSLTAVVAVWDGIRTGLNALVFSFSSKPRPYYRAFSFSFSFSSIWTVSCLPSKCRRESEEFIAPSSISSWLWFNWWLAGHEKGCRCCIVTNKPTRPHTAPFAQAPRDQIAGLSIFGGQDVGQKWAEIGGFASHAGTRSFWGRAIGGCARGSGACVAYLHFQWRQNPDVTHICVRIYYAANTADQYGGPILRFSLLSFFCFIHIGRTRQGKNMDGFVGQFCFPWLALWTSRCSRCLASVIMQRRGRLM